MKHLGSPPQNNLTVTHTLASINTQTWYQHSSNAGQLDELALDSPAAFATVKKEGCLLDELFKLSKAFV